MEMLYTDCNHDQIPEEAENDLCADLICCQNIALPEGELSQVYIGPCGIFAVSSGCDDFRALYYALRNELNSPHVCLCVDEKGLYDPLCGRIEPFSYETSLDASLEFWTLQRRPVLDEPGREGILRRLRMLDARTRGRYIDEDGIVYILRGGKFVPTSTLDPNLMYWVTLFGSSFGLHRFFMGKFFSGIVYLFTCGLFGCGWLLDSFSLLTGIQRDKKGRLVRLPDNRLKKLLAVPVGFLVAFLTLTLYLTLLQTVSLALDTGVQAIVDHPSFTDVMFQLWNKISSLQP